MSKRIIVNVPLDITPYIPKTADQWELYTADKSWVIMLYAALTETE